MPISKPGMRLCRRARIRQKARCSRPLLVQRFLPRCSRERFIFMSFLFSLFSSFLSYLPLLSPPLSFSPLLLPSPFSSLLLSLRWARQNMLTQVTLDKEKDMMCADSRQMAQVFTVASLPVYVCVRVHVQICVYVYVCICVCVCVYAHVYLPEVLISLHLHVNTLTLSSTISSTHTHTHTNTRIENAAERCRVRRVWQ